MNTIACRYCGATGTTLHYDEDVGTYAEMCLVCGGTGQAPCDESGRTDFKRVFEKTLGIAEFLKGKEVVIEEMMAKYKIPKEEMH